MTKLIIIRGIPGAGKSRLAATLLESGVVDYVAETDQYWIQPDGVYKFDPSMLGVAHADCQRRVAELLSIGNSVAVANTLTTEAEVAVYESIAAAYGAEFVSIIVENRHGNTNVHGVPSGSLKRMRDRFSVRL